MERLNEGKLLEPKNMFKRCVGICMNQMSAKAGIKKHGEEAVSAILKEFGQLEHMKTFRPRHKHDLTREQLSRAMRIITVIKEKRSGVLKGRSCVDGRPQRAYVSKEEAASPTTALESLLITLLIDAWEERDVATADVVGAYLNAYMEDFVLVKLVGDEVDIISRINPIYKEYITSENGKKVLYLQLIKALYGCIKSALLWYECFTKCLFDMGFKLNDHDKCVANKVIEGTQCTIVWYVDDNKISHVNSKVVDQIIAEIEKRFGKMTVKRGKEHVFVGMNISFIGDNKVKLTMKSYLEEAIQAFGEDVSAGAVTPASRNLFVVNNDLPFLETERAEIFHHVVAKLLYVAKRARVDIQLAIAFLCTRVSKSTQEDWEKLRRVLKYIHRTIDLPRIIGVKDFSVLQTWVDASYATHPNMRSHTGGVISLGHGIINSKSSKQKINTKSSTEAELVGASDFISHTMWTDWFLKGQGYVVKSNIFYQDNQSAILLEKNGRNSCGEKSRHINIRYFFIKDVLKRERITVTHCPTEQMIADYFTKPLQGNLFTTLRDTIMGIILYPNKERVENKMCSGNERKEIKPSTNNKGDNQVNEENKVIDPTPKDS